MEGRYERSAAINALIRKGARTPFASAPAPDINNVVTHAMDPHGEEREREKWRTQDAQLEHRTREPLD